MNGQPRADALVLFGSTGDLAKRKLFPALYALAKRGHLDVPVIGVARSDWTDDDFRAHAKASIEEFVDGAEVHVIEDVLRQLDLVQGDYSATTTWAELEATLDRCGSKTAVYYMAIPPDMFPTVAEALASVGLNERGRIVVEKPFGRDLESARHLNEVLHTIFPEERIFRIDHYLGKEAVEDLLVFRFSNMLLEPIWNRNYVRSVQVTMTEKIGVEGRGAFYETVGATRDVLQNHALQIVSLLAMEPPVGPESSFLQDEKAKVLAAMEPVDPSCMVRGQYVGYRDEPGVAAESDVETFIAVRLMIDSWRWAGVPWFVRVGKALTDGVSEAVVELREPPQLLFDEAGGPVPKRNLVRFRLGKRDGVTFTLQAKTPGPHLDSQEVDIGVDFAAALGERQDAYERLLATPSTAHRGASPARMSSSRRGGSSNRRSTTRERSTRTSGARGAPPNPTVSSTETRGSSRADGLAGCGRCRTLTVDLPCLPAHARAWPLRVGGASRERWHAERIPRRAVGRPSHHGCTRCECHRTRRPGGTGGRGAAPADRHHVGHRGLRRGRPRRRWDRDGPGRRHPAAPRRRGARSDDAGRRAVGHLRLRRHRFLLLRGPRHPSRRAQPRSALLGGAHGHTVRLVRCRCAAGRRQLACAGPVSVPHPRNDGAHQLLLGRPVHERQRGSRRSAGIVGDLAVQPHQSAGLGRVRTRHRTHPGSERHVRPAPKASSG